MKATLFSILCGGCGTTIAAAQKLGRTWIGIDVTHLAVGLMKLRLKDSFGMIPLRPGSKATSPLDVRKSSAFPEGAANETSGFAAHQQAGPETALATYRVIGQRRKNVVGQCGSEYVEI